MNSNLFVFITSALLLGLLLSVGSIGTIHCNISAVHSWLRDKQATHWAFNLAPLLLYLLI